MSSTNQGKENQFKECLDKFLKYRSNSSYEVTKKLNDFNAVYSLYRGTDFTFMTHAAGIWFLHLPEIEKAYDEKRKNLTIFKAYFDYGILEELINKSAEQMAAWDSNKELSEFKDEISCKIFNNLEGFLVAIRDRNLEDFFADFVQIGTRFNPVYGIFRDSERLKIEWKETSPDFSFVKSGNENLAVKFYSDLRLLNEIEKNRMEQVKVNTLRWGFKEIEWKYPGNTNIKIECHVNDYPEGKPIHTVYRSVFVPGISTYEHICERTNLYDTEKISSSFTDRSSPLTDFQANLHFLLFGAEVMRNPSALIHNMMIMDLLKGNIPRKESTGVGYSDMESTSTEIESAMKRTWKEIYGNDFIPMGRVNSERAARIINDEYNDYMPHKYSFDTTFKDFSKLFSPDQQNCFYQVANAIIEKEWLVIKSWLIMKYGEEKFNEICHNDRSIFFGILKEALKEWYNVNIY